MKYNNKDEIENGEERQAVIVGRNSVLEALKSGAVIEKIYVARGDGDGLIVRILSIAKEKNIPITQVDRRKLNFLSGTSSHQGIVASIGGKEYCTIDDLLDIAKEKGEEPFLVMCNEITDPHNLGAIIRSAEALGAHGVIIQKHRSVGVTTTVAKSSAGAIFHINIAKVTNIASTIEDLKKKNIWVYGTDANCTHSLYDVDFKGGVCIVVGSEGHGMNRLVREKCDFILGIELYGKVNSLNASVAAGIVLSECAKKRHM